MQGLPSASCAVDRHFSPLADLADLVAAAFARASIFLVALVVLAAPDGGEERRWMKMSLLT